MTQEKQFEDIWYANQSKQVELTKLYLEIYPDIDTLIGKFSKTTLLDRACFVGNYELVKFLLENGADVNVCIDGRNPLHTAIGNLNYKNELNIIKLLCMSGVNIKQKLKGPYEQTCFLLALQIGNVEIVKYLDTNFVESCSKSIEFNNLGLHFASGNERDERVLEYCLTIDKNVNKLDEYNQTPLHYTYGEKTKVKQLLSFGADINAQDHGGQTVLHLCVDYEMETAINGKKELNTSNTVFLLSNGANKNILNIDGDKVRKPAKLTTPNRSKLTTIFSGEDFKVHCCFSC